MKLNKMFLISITLLILLLSISSVSASDLGQDSNQTLATDSSEVETVAVNEDVGDVEAVAVNEDVDVVIRPEDIYIVDESKGYIEGTVESVTFKAPFSSSIFSASVLSGTVMLEIALASTGTK